MKVHYIGIMALVMTFHVSCGENSKDNQAKVKTAEELARAGIWKEVNYKVAPKSVIRKVDGKYSILTLLKNIRDQSKKEYHLKWAPSAGHVMLARVLDRWIETLKEDINAGELTKEELMVQLQNDFILQHGYRQDLIEGYIKSGQNLLGTAYFPIIREKIKQAFDSDESEQTFGCRMDEERVLLTSMELYRNTFRDFTTRQMLHNEITDAFTGSVGIKRQN